MLQSAISSITVISIGIEIADILLLLISMYRMTSTVNSQHHTSLLALMKGTLSPPKALLLRSSLLVSMTCACTSESLHGG